MLLVWDENAWEDYLWWQAQDRKVLKRVNALLVDIGEGRCGHQTGVGLVTDCARVPALPAQPRAGLRARTAFHRG